MKKEREPETPRQTVFLLVRRGVSGSLSFFSFSCFFYFFLSLAIVCGNDMIAKRLTESFRKIGVRVPEDVALTGFDDDEDRMLYPFFSTVHVDTKWLGRRMVHEFLWREEHPEAPKERILVSGEVVVRRSSCKR